MTKEILIKDITIGGGNKIAVQSMTNTKTADVESTVAQINDLANAGCDIVRFTVNDDAAADAVSKIVASTKVPLVADIHFDYKLAIKAIESGIHKIRINPGNIGGILNVKAVVAAAKAHKIPIRIGVNSGSIEKELLDKLGNSSEALFQSAVKNVNILESFGFDDIVISAKASSVRRTVEVYRKLSVLQYPLHLGVTEAGYGEAALLKSSVAILSLIHI